MTYTPTVLTNAYISIANNNISDHCTKVELPIKVEGKETTTFGAAGGYKTRVGGLKDASLKFSLNNDFVAGNWDSIIFPLLGSVVTAEIRADAGTVTTSNPKWTFSILIDSHTPVNGSVGDIDTVDYDFPISGAVTRGTS